MKLFMIIRFFGLLIVAIQVYIKILNITNISKTKILLGIIFSILMSIPLSFVPPFYELLFLCSCIIFLGITTKVKLNVLITAVFISTGISLGIEILAFTIIFLSSNFLNFLLNFGHNLWVVIPKGNFSFIPVIEEVLILIVSLVISNFFFKLKRLKKGFVFLEIREAKWVGIVFSIVIMFSRSILDEMTSLLITINICTIGMHFWWKYHTSILYSQRLMNRDIKRYSLEIEDKNKLINDLYTSNDFLSKTIHRDNKLIPAMYNAVNAFITSYNNVINSDIKTNGMDILNELNEIMKQRQEINLILQKEINQIPTTGIKIIDYILNHMILKASEKQIQFDFILNNNIKEIAEKAISKEDLETLLADLLENAIIAVSNSDNKKILITMSIIDECFELTVEDSGIPFEIETIVNLGIKNTTTHSNTGGTGIGYLSIFEILKKCNASITILEKNNTESTFLKSIKIVFDNKCEYKVNSYRAEDIQLLSKRKDIIITKIMD